MRIVESEWARAAGLLLALAGALVPAGIVAQPGPLRVVPVLRLEADAGGPETLRGVLAVSASGHVAFTFGSDDGDRHVTLIDSTGRVLSRFGGRGSGPGEFQSVLALFFDEERAVLFGVGQLSAFTYAGNHVWSRAVPSSYMALSLNKDSVDLMAATYFQSGANVGEIRRRSIALNGGDRLLVSASDPAMRKLARAPADSTRFVRLAFASTGRELVIGNGQSYQLIAMNAAGKNVRAFGRSAPVLRRSPQEVNAELARQVALASRPFRLPDGTMRQNPVPTASIRARIEAPQSYFSAREGGLQMDQRSGDVYVIESHADSVTIVRFRSGRSAQTSVKCDRSEERRVGKEC